MSSKKKHHKRKAHTEQFRRLSGVSDDRSCSCWVLAPSGVGMPRRRPKPQEPCWPGILLASRPRFPCGMEGTCAAPHGTGSRGSLRDDGCVKAPAVKPAWFLLSSTRPGPNFVKATGQRFTVKSSPGYPKALSCCCSGHDRSCPRQGEGQWQLCNPGDRNPPELMPASTHACCASIAQTQTGLWVRGPHSHSG